MFMFDCSGSMGAKVAIGANLEGPSQLPASPRDSRSPEAPWNRFSSGSSCRRIRIKLGLIIYGHRVGWNPKNQDQVVMRNPKNPQRVHSAPAGI